MSIPVRLALLCSIAVLAACSSEETSDATLPAIEEFTINAPLLTESSGIARSQREPGLFWSHNDSGGPAAAYAFDARGEYRGQLTVTGAINLDWEDMSSFSEDGQPRLLIADIGDNNAFRPLLTLYVVAEPAMPTGQVTEARALPLRTLLVLYPDGPRDCESIAVDSAEGAIYLLSKRDPLPRLYRVPLNPLVPVVVATALGDTQVPRAPAGHENPQRYEWVTSMDINSDATALAAITESQLHVYRREAGEPWIAAMQRPPLSHDLPNYKQIEAVTWAQEGDAVYITSEGSPTPLARIAVPR